MDDWEELLEYYTKVETPESLVKAIKDSPMKMEGVWESNCRKIPYYVKLIGDMVVISTKIYDPDEREDNYWLNVNNLNECVKM